MAELRKEMGRSMLHADWPEKVYRMAICEVTVHRAF